LGDLDGLAHVLHILDRFQVLFGLHLELAGFAVVLLLHGFDHFLVLLNAVVVFLD